MELYGITGDKFAGKDTFARMLGGEWHITHFADKIKNICATAFNLPIRYFQDPDLKEKPFLPIDIDKFLPTLRSLTCIDLEPQRLVADTPRLLLQYVGTNYVRSVQYDYWLQELSTSIKPYSKVLIPDTRFLNESSLIRDHGGKIIKIVRIDSKTESDPHLSEVEMRSIIPDLLIGSVTGKLWLPQLIADLLRSENFRKARLFDYRRLSALEFEVFSDSFYDAEGYSNYAINSSFSILNYYYYN